MGQNGGARPGAGRKPGSVSKSTMQALVLRQKMVDMYEKAAEHINLALLKKAMDGDVLAIKEIHDRVYGKSFQPGQLDVTSNGNAIQITDDQYKQALAAAIKRGDSDKGSA